MTKQLKFTHWIFIVFTGVCVIAPPAKANLAAVIALINSVIQTTLGGFNALIHMENANGQAIANSHKMSAETLGGIMANQTKTLGSLEQKMNFGSFGKIGDLKINAISSSGCFTKKKADTYKDWMNTKEQAFTEKLPELNAYAAVQAEIDFGQDSRSRRGIFNRAKELGLLEMGLHPTRKLSTEEYEIWVDLIKYLTVPSPISEKSALSPAAKLKLIQNTERYKQLVGVVQESLLRHALSNKRLEGDLSRNEMITSYEAYANSFERTRSANLKTQAGVLKELAEAEAMSLDLNAEINQTNESIEALLTVIAIDSTDNYAKRINQ